MRTPPPARRPATACAGPPGRRRPAGAAHRDRARRPSWRSSRGRGRRSRMAGRGTRGADGCATAPAQAVEAGRCRIDAPADRGTRAGGARRPLGLDQARRPDRGARLNAVHVANAPTCRVAEHSAAMTTSIIVSYDGTTNDDDALALGAQLAAAAGATLALAYVRHTREYDPRREELGEYDATRRLEQGAAWLQDPDIIRHVVIDPSTSAGLARLAADEGAELVLFGSDYRTPPGHVEPGASAQGILEGGAVAVGVAQAGLRGAAEQTAQSLAAALGAEIVSGGSEADLILVDSQPDAPAGRVALGGATRA